MKLTCPICGQETITVRPDLHFDPESGEVAFRQDCDCSLTEEQFDELADEWNFEGVD